MGADRGWHAEPVGFEIVIVLIYNHRRIEIAGYKKPPKQGFRLGRFAGFREHPSAGRQFAQIEQNGRALGHHLTVGVEWGRGFTDRIDRQILGISMLAMAEIDLPQRQRETGTICDRFRRHAAHIRPLIKHIFAYRWQVKLAPPLSRRSQNLPTGGPWRSANWRFYHRWREYRRRIRSVG